MNVRSGAKFAWSLRVAVWVASVGCVAAVAAELGVKTGQKVAFLGDSITAGGMGPVGYVSLSAAGLKANGVEITVIGAGVGGHKSNDMLGRLERDVLSKKPDWMTLSCGVNDVWHGERGVPLDAYKTNISAIVERCQAAGVKVMILTATVIGEDVGNPNNLKLAPYNGYLRTLAKEKGCLLADLNADFQAVLKESGKTGGVLTGDGVHMNARGNQVMAKGILRAFGLEDAQLAKAADAWLDIPGAVEYKPALQGSVRLSLRRQQQLEAIAARHKLTAEQLVRAVYGADLAGGGALATAAEIETWLDQSARKEPAAVLQERLTNRLDLLRP